MTDVLGKYANVTGLDHHSVANATHPYMSIHLSIHMSILVCIHFQMHVCALVHASVYKYVQCTFVYRVSVHTSTRHIYIHVAVRMSLCHVYVCTGLKCDLHTNGILATTTKKTSFDLI